MAQACIDFPDGYASFKHFPAGTYDAQMERPYGRQEMDIMRLLYRCWHTFAINDVTTWKANDLRLVNDLMMRIDDRVLNGLIRALWGIDG